MELHRETKYIAKQTVRDRNLITANGTAPMEFAKEILLALNVASEDKILDWYNFYKLGFYTAPMLHICRRSEADDIFIKKWKKG